MVRELLYRLVRMFGPGAEKQPLAAFASIKTLSKVAQFVASPECVFLVSFPRTGSHWLRMLMEKYFERPQLKLTYYYKDSDHYLTYHTHDLALDVTNPNVIYLYRDPVETIYSQMVYENSPSDDQAWIRYWSDIYGLHLHKWLEAESFTTKKTLVRYDRLQSDLAGEFAKVVAHLGEEFDAERFARCAENVTREEVAQKRQEIDPRVIDVTKSYGNGRKRFRERHSESVWSVLLDSRPFLRKFFPEARLPRAK
jgi:Sulfotransferase domain